MASKTRSTKRNAPLELDVSSLSNTERLLLAQAVYELGGDAWVEVAKLLTKHPLITRPKNTFTSDLCEELYTQLMQDANLNLPDNQNAVHAPVHLKLAQRHYQARVFELRDLISAEEVKFKNLVKEIDEIRAGLWDEKIQSKRRSATQSQHATPTAIVATAPIAETPEIRPSTPIHGDTITEAPIDENMASPSPVPAEHTVISHPEEDAALGAGQAPDEDVISSEAPEAPSHEGPSHVDQDSAVVVNQESQSSDEEAEGAQAEPVAEEASPSGPGTMSLENAVSLADEELPLRDTASPDAPLELEVPREVAVDEVDAGEDVQMAADAESPAEEEQEIAPNPEDVELQQVTEATEVEADEEESPRAAFDTADREATPDAAEQEATPSAAEEEASPVAIETETTPSTVEQEATPGAAEQEATPSADSDIPRRRGGKRRASEAADSLRDRKRVREDSEAADEDTQSFTGRRRGARPVPDVDPAALKRFQTVINMLHSQIAQHRNGAIFQNPIKTSEAPDYHDIVRRPMDLKTIKQKIKDGLIVNSSEFQRDIYLIFANAMMYNRPGSDIYYMAEQMMLDSEAHINTFRQTEGFVRGVHRI
ncbi:hypothetical protein OE88DRAFT_1652567 [Heliocybe sulcata]|uniref:Bromo domain-containing protein n=1 Tax=Heliocybe sulcata TaxID=5364 RepID=A0A5C3NE54_9AGAM|nr:hypothetical protein OE88DRAFT_1652567 [Heliocybe sulcata]